MPEELPSLSLNKHLIDLFVSDQSIATQKILAVATVSYVSGDRPENRRLLIRFPHQTVASGFYQQRHCLKIPAVLNGVQITIEAPNFLESIAPIEDLKMSQVNTAANPLSDLDALKKVYALQEEGKPAGITFFMGDRTDHLVIHVNKALEDFTGQTRETLLKDNVMKLTFSPESVNDITELQRRLKQDGYVEDFQLVSMRTNGQYGIYTIDAWYVDWAGEDARLTLYKSFEPIDQRVR